MISKEAEKLFRLLLEECQTHPNQRISTLAGLLAKQLTADAAVKICYHCLLSLPITEFGVLRASPDGHCRYCKACKRILNNEYNVDRSEFPMKGSAGRVR